MIFDSHNESNIGMGMPFLEDAIPIREAVPVSVHRISVVNRNLQDSPECNSS